MGPTDAKKMALLTQVASGLLLLGAVAVVGMGGVGRAVEPHESLVVDPAAYVGGEDEEGEGAGDELPPTDFAGISERLNNMRNAPKKPEAPVDPEPEVTEPEDPVEDMMIEVAFLGPITVGSRRGALVNAGGKQRMVFEGGLVTTPDGDVRVVRIAEREIVVDDGSGEREVRIGERTGGAVTSAAPGGGRGGSSAGFTTPNAQADRNGARETAQGSEPEDRRADYQRRRREAITRALEDGRISDEDAQRMFDRLDAANEAQREADGN